MTPEMKTIRLSEMQFDEVIYPRRDHNPALVQRYAEVIDEIEAAQRFIAVSADLKLLDGKHRWLAYRKHANGTDREIMALVYPVTAPHEQLKLAAKLNSDHGWQLTDEDKAETAKSLFAYGSSYDEIAASLSVGKVKVTEWLRQIVKEKRQARDQKILDLWMQCATQEEIAGKTETPVGTVNRLLGDGEESLLRKVLENRTKESLACFEEADWSPPLYNVWTFAKKTNETSHFGNSEQRIVENLLYAYTEPFDIVLDPFAGGGSTIDVRKKRLRRYWVSDRKPIVERECEIRQLDIVKELPPLNKRWSEVTLTYLDPPYWRQAEGQYSDDPEDLANMLLEEFTEALAGVVNRIAAKQSRGVIALIIQPTQWKSDRRAFIDHVIDMVKVASPKRLTLENRISCPYSTEQYNAQQVEWAKANKKFLVLTRELIVWRVMPS
jgi:DNA methylase